MDLTTYEDSTLEQTDLDGELEGPSGDRQLVLANAQRIQDALNIGDAECGRAAGTKHRSALCSQRRVLVVLGWITFADYKKRSIGSKSTPAIKRLQKALGVTADGIWGQATNGAMGALLKEALGPNASADAAYRYVGPKGGGGSSTPDEGDDGGKKKSLMLMAGLPILVVLGGATLTLWLLKRGTGATDGVSYVDQDGNPVDQLGNPLDDADLEGT